MFFKRRIVFVVAILLAIGIFSAVSAAGQRDAWMQGYVAGRLSTGTDGGAAIAPYMMYGGNYGPHFGFGGMSLFWVFGLLLFAFFLISRSLHWRGQHGSPEDWHARMDEARRHAEQWHERYQRHWEERAPDRGADNEQRMV